MSDLLKFFEEEWKKDGHFRDVVAKMWEPGDPIEEKCPEGCDLHLHEVGERQGWRRLDNRDVYRTTRFCHEHRFTRIYAFYGAVAAISIGDKRVEYRRIVGY